MLVLTLYSTVCNIFSFWFLFVAIIAHVAPVRDTLQLMAASHETLVDSGLETTGKFHATDLTSILWINLTGHSDCAQTGGNVFVFMILDISMPELVAMMLLDHKWSNSSAFYLILA